MTSQRSSSVLAALSHNPPVYSSSSLRPQCRIRLTSASTATHRAALPLLFHHRLASTSSAAASQKRSPPPTTTTTTTTPTTTPPPRPHQPPASTLPAPLTTPSRAQDQSLINYLYKTGRAYTSFYWTGIKNIRHNRTLAKAIEARISSASRNDAATAAGRGDVKTAAAGPAVATRNRIAAIEALSGTATAGLTRAEWQLLLRSRYDMRRVPIFALLFLILGEWLPLVVIYFTALVPRTCRIPLQVDREIRKLETRRRESLREMNALRAIAGKGGEAAKDEGAKDGTQAQGTGQLATEVIIKEDNRVDRKTELVHLSRCFGLHSKMWDRLLGGLPTALVARKVRNRFDYLAEDDRLLLRDGSVKDLTKEETKEACVERGIDVLGRKEEEMRRI
ncbi:hypothetical protein H2199_002243 [Coniosporium tulheliwenetii]|uniref:Uncharacterized protein n=1 Tax=Coniosporium tulheliwenetii TaxID=3383036 RepID=A0ACC2ZI80_9PEZI|nr:hypothetical protein H2199_002243 [Cladosporium sp. JES 115]